MRNLSNEERKLIIIQFLNFLSYALAGVFVSVFFFAHSDLKTTIFYNIVSFTSFAFFYGLSGITLRKISSGLMMKISFLASALYYFLLFFFKERSIAYLVPLGILGGFSGGNYWSAFNLNQYILTHSGRRAEYIGWNLALINFASALGPVLGGWIIAGIGQLSGSISTGYAILFLIVFTILTAAVILIEKLPSHDPPQFSYRHVIHHRRSTRWGLVLWQQGLMGFFDVALSTVSGILLYILLRGEAALGLALTVASALGAIGSIVSIAFLKRYRYGFWIGVIGTVIAVYSLGSFDTIFGGWVYILVLGMTAAFYVNALTLEVYRVLDASPGGWKNKYHLLLEQSVVISVFRVAGFILLYIFLQFGDEIAVTRLWLRVLPIIPILIGVLLHRSTKTARSAAMHPVPLADTKNLP